MITLDMKGHGLDLRQSKTLKFFDFQDHSLVIEQLNTVNLEERECKRLSLIYGMVNTLYQNLSVINGKLIGLVTNQVVFFGLCDYSMLKTHYDKPPELKLPIKLFGFTSIRDYYIAKEKTSIEHFF